MSQLLEEHAPSRPGTRWAAWRFVALTVLTVGLLQTAWILVLPPFAGQDEIDHAYRASAVAHGELEPGRFATHGRGRLVTASQDLVRAARPRCVSIRYYGNDNCHPVGAARGGLVRVASSASSYNVAYYAVVGTVGRAFHGADSLYAMRVATALLALGLVGAGAWCLGRRRWSRWRYIGICLALTPVAIYSTAIVAPNGVEIAAGFALWGALLALGDRLRQGAERSVLVVAGVAAVVLADLRNLGPGFLAAAVAVAVLIGPRQARAVLGRHRALVAVLLVAVLGSLGQQLWWNHLMSQMAGAPVVPEGRVGWSASLPIAWELGTVAAFPFRDQAAPLVVYVLFLFAFAAVWVQALRRGYGRARLGLLVLSVGVLVMPLVLTAASYQTLGVIWQGRYGLPLAVGVPLLAVVALEARGVRTRSPLVAALAAALVVVDLSCMLHVRAIELARPVTGVDTGWPTRQASVLVLVVLMAGVARLVALLTGPRRTSDQP